MYINYAVALNDVIAKLNFVVEVKWVQYQFAGWTVNVLGVVCRTL